MLDHLRANKTKQKQVTMGINDQMQDQKKVHYVPLAGIRHIT